MVGDRAHPPRERGLRRVLAAVAGGDRRVGLDPGRDPDQRPDVARVPGADLDVERGVDGGTGRLQVADLERQLGLDGGDGVGELGIGLLEQVRDLADGASGRLAPAAQGLDLGAQDHERRGEHPRGADVRRLVQSLERLVPAAEQHQRLGLVGDGHRADGAHLAQADGELHAGRRDPRGVGGAPAEEQDVGEVDRRADRLLVGAQGERLGRRRLEQRNPALDVAGVRRRAAQGDPRAQLLELGAGGAGGLRRLLGHRDRRVHLADAQAPIGQGREHGRPQSARRLRRQRGDRGLEVGQAVLVAAEVAQRSRAMLEHLGAPLGLGAAAEPALGAVEERDGTVHRPRQVGGLAGPPVQLDGVDPRALRRVGDLRPELERALEMALGLGRRVAGHDLLRGLERGVERPREVERGVPVVGEHRRGGELRAGQAAVGGQRLAEGGVEPGSLPGQQVVVERGAGERVAEGVAAALRIDDQQLVLDGLAQRGVERRLVEG